MTGKKVDKATDLSVPGLLHESSSYFELAWLGCFTWPCKEKLSHGASGRSKTLLCCNSLGPG